MTGDTILILDLGGEQAQLTARKLRGERFFCEILPSETRADEIERRAPKGVVIAGGADGPAARQADPCALMLGIPVLAMGYGARLMAVSLGGQLLGTQIERRTAQIAFSDSPLFDGLG